MRVKLVIPEGEMRPYKLGTNVIPHGEHYGFNNETGDLIGAATASSSWVRFDKLKTLPKHGADRQTMYVSCPNRYLVRLTN